jgi:DNA-binding CsgD family transcriptional regulator
MCQGGPIAMTYAARHPERVDRLVLYGTYARGKNHRRQTPEDRQHAEALIALTRTGWGQRNPAYRRLFTTLFIPGGSDKQISWFDELQLLSCTGAHAARAREVKFDLDVTSEAASIGVPTLVLHARDDALVPFEEGRHLAALVPGAQFVPLDSRNHILLEDEPAWTDFCRALDDFLGVPAPEPEPAAIGRFRTLTNREREILSLVAAGYDNDAIAADRSLSVRTVERHLSNIYLKLGLTGRAARAGAAAAFIRHEAVTTR